MSDRVKFLDTGKKVGDRNLGAMLHRLLHLLEDPTRTHHHEHHHYCPNYHQHHDHHDSCNNCHHHHHHHHPCNLQTMCNRPPTLSGRTNSSFFTAVQVIPLLINAIVTRLQCSTLLCHNSLLIG